MLKAIGWLLMLVAVVNVILGGVHIFYYGNGETYQGFIHMGVAVVTGVVGWAIISSKKK